VGLHLHNTRNTGFANAYAALEAGAEVFESSVGGLGGCPFAPRATGNIATRISSSSYTARAWRRGSTSML
jgi:hydroxymethylglutaryl-CoA lyase/(R)-citramalyl-CoA lyase